MSSGGAMRDFWDRRAREDAHYFVDNRLTYRDPQGEETFWARGREDLDLIFQTLELDLGPADRVVEIGCGVGRLTRVMAGRAASVVALDVSAEMLAQAQAQNPHLDNVEWLQGDGTSLAGVPDASVTFGFSHVVFQHIPDPQITLGYIRELGRVLEPGGVAGFQVSNDADLHRRGAMQSLRGRAKALVGRGPGGQAEPEWIGSAVELDDVRAAAADGGMQVELVVGEGAQFCLVRTRKFRGTG